ncbi:MAG: hypothetical protein ACI92I_000512 [Acidimicrobiales bacterium]|jgi:hypothetical protein
MGNRTFKTPEQYLFNIAKTVCSKIGGVNIEDVGVHHDSEEFPNQFWGTYQMKIVRALSDHGPEALGRIAAVGKGHKTDGHICHWDMNQGRHLTDAADGDHILLTLAAYVVGAKIADMVRQNLRKQEEYDQAQEDLLDRAMHHSPIPVTRRYGDKKWVQIGDGRDSRFQGKGF